MTRKRYNILQATDQPIVPRGRDTEIVSEYDQNIYSNMAARKQLK